ncbi:MAG: hypothetical protein JRJ38_16525 [Deltaproteobacteria bacterium]|nr:hypothetical protein [Deltaproteobacteria bacterium]
MRKEKIVRRKYILDKPFQFGYVTVMILLQLCVAVVVGFGMSYLYLFVFNDGKIACQHNVTVLLQWAILVGFSSLVLIIWGIVYSHRIIAPIHRMRILLRSAASGDIPSGKVAFRKNDCFKGLEDDLANCFETMEEYKEGWINSQKKQNKIAMDE